MKITREKTIRPTKLQPQLFSVINKLASKNDYRIVVDRNNEPLCALVSYSLLENMDLKDQFDEDSLGAEVAAYYQDMPEEEKELMDLAIDDGIN